jgi:DNA-binding CsgD family transcriptional regulator
VTKPHGIIEDIGAAIGYTATSTLVRWYAESTLYVPLEAREDHALAKIIGMPAYRRLVADFAGHSIRIPKPITEADARARRVARLLRAGRTDREIADAEGVTERRAQQLRKQLVDGGILELLNAAN